MQHLPDDLVSHVLTFFGLENMLATEERASGDGVDLLTMTRVCKSWRTIMARRVLPLKQRAHIVVPRWHWRTMCVFHQYYAWRSCLCVRVTLDFAVRTSDLYTQRHLLAKLCRLLERRHAIVRLELIVNTPQVPVQLCMSLARCTWLEGIGWYQDFGELPFDPEHPEQFDTRNIPSLAATLQEALFPHLAACTHLTSIDLQNEHINANDIEALDAVIARCDAPSLRLHIMVRDQALPMPEIARLLATRACITKVTLYPRLWLPSHPCVALLFRFDEEKGCLLRIGSVLHSRHDPKFV